MRTGFVLVGAEDGDVSLWWAESPGFSTKKINHGFVVMGSGADAVRPALDARFAEIEASSPQLKLQADFVRGVVEAQLKQASNKTVGGLFQAITVEGDGIRPMTYGFTSMDPESTAPSMSMGFEKGTWVQRVETTGKAVPVGEPATVIQRGISGIVVQDLEPTPEAEKRGIWRLCYLVPCFAGTRDHNAIEFKGEWSAIGAREFPLDLDATVAIGFWGSPGKHTLEVKLTQGGITTSLLSTANDVPHPIEVVDRVTRVHLTIKEPGPAFLECFVDGSLLGHKALFFSKVPPDLNPLDAAAVEKVRQEQIEEQYSHADPYLEDHVATLSYWSVCRKAHWEPSLLRFENEMQAVYWKTYPLPLRVTFAAGFQTRPGTRLLRVDLVHATSRAVTPGTTATVQAVSSMETVHVHGETIVNVPAAGWYFFDLYVDNALIGCSMICAETEKAKYSYSPLPPDATRIAAGELLILSRRVPSLADLRLKQGGSSKS